MNARRHCSVYLNIKTILSIRNCGGVISLTKLNLLGAGRWVGAGSTLIRRHDLVLGPSQCRFSVVCLLGMFAKNVNYFRNCEDADSAGLSVQCSRYLRKASVRLI